MTKPNQPWFVRRPLPAQVEKVHLIGIAGAGMGAFAAMLQDIGKTVRGSDLNVYPPMSDELHKRGIQWMEGWDPAHLDWGPDLVIVGNVCRRDNPESVAAAQRGIAAVSFPQAFGDLFLEGRTPVVIAGTHGKTTTTALTTWLLHAAGLDPSMLVGGVARNFDATYRLAAGQPFVVEGDEYDTAWFDKGPKFLHYRPQIVVLNNIEFDHADIYDSLEEIVENFERLMDLLGPTTTLLVNADDARAVACARRARGAVVTYGFAEGADLRAVAVVPGPAGCDFVLERAGEAPLAVHSALAGRHNVWNALAALGVGLTLGASVSAMVGGLATYAGVKKRQEEKGEAAGVLVVDDYAHHPTAIDETLAALKARYVGRRLVAVYEPKSNTARRNVHQDDYAHSFRHADFAVVCRPFQKEDRFAPEERLDVRRLVADIAAEGTPAIFQDGSDATLAWLLATVVAGDVVVFMSSSGFDGIHDRLLAGLAGR